jgi:hypothetical protein
VEHLREQAERIAGLEALVAELRERLDAAARAGSRNSGNSSMPPSGDDLPGRKPPRKERRAAERAEKKSRGKQPGAPGAAMRMRKPDETLEHYPEGACECGLDLGDAADLGVARFYQQEDVPEPRLSRRYQHNLHKAECACGKVHVAPRPDGVPDAPLSVGPRLSAMAVYLAVFQHVPVERAQRLIADLTGGRVPAGFVHSCLAKAAGLVKDSVALIRTLIAASPVAGFDETTLDKRCSNCNIIANSLNGSIPSGIWLTFLAPTAVEAASWIDQLALAPGDAARVITMTYDEVMVYLSRFATPLALSVVDGRIASATNPTLEQFYALGTSEAARPPRPA